MQFMQEAVDDGYRHIALSLPTGVGKTYLGAAFCFWATQFRSENHYPGGYFAVVQKLLQDQLERDFPKFKPPFKSHLLKSATEYECPYAETCAAGLLKIGDKSVCGLASSKNEVLCEYKINRQKFLQADLACSNYSFLFTERWNSKKFPARQVAVLDEGHNIEQVILRFVELAITEKILFETTPQIKNLPVLRTLRKFTDWVRQIYLPIVSRQYEDLADRAERDPKAQKELTALETLLNKTLIALESIDENPGNWVYSQEKNDKEQLESSAKPISAVPFFPMLIQEMGRLRLYLSAFLGSKDIFCRSLGIPPDRIAWLEMDSPFPVENRQIVVLPAGSMSLKNLNESLPGFLRLTEKILERHAEERGVIHSSSYRLAKIIFEHFQKTPQGQRFIFPTDADQREEAFKKHSQSKNSVLISPSMMEGFDFKGDLARWQIIAKVPFKAILDPQISAKRELDTDWYDLDVVSSLIQTCGRCVRSESDFGTTFILDSDFITLFKKRDYMFPKWWKDALIIQK